MNRKLAIALFMILVVYPTAVSADEVQLKSKVQCEGSIVRLKDIATVRSASTDRQAALENIELFPTPMVRKTIDANRIRHCLANHDVDMFNTFVTGASVVTLEPPMRTVRTKVGSIGASYSTGDDLDSSNKQTLMDKIPRRIERIQPEINLRKVVTLNAPIDRGDIIRRDQLTLAPARGAWNDQWATDIEQIVGKQSRRSIGPGTPLLVRDFEKAIMVHRNNECKIISKTGSVSVSTTGKAKQDGAIGDTIQVQSLDRKRTYFGTVTGPQTVTISN